MPLKNDAATRRMLVLKCLPQNDAATENTACLEMPLKNDAATRRMFVSKCLPQNDAATGRMLFLKCLP